MKKLLENFKDDLYYLAADYIIDINSVLNYSDNNLKEYEIFQDGNWKRPKVIILKIFDKNQQIKLIMNTKPLHRYFNW